MSNKARLTILLQQIGRLLMKRHGNYTSLKLIKTSATPTTNNSQAIFFYLHN